MQLVHQNVWCLMMWHSGDWHMQQQIRFYKGWEGQYSNLSAEIKSYCEKVHKDDALINFWELHSGTSSMPVGHCKALVPKSLLQVLVLARFFPPLWASHAEDRGWNWKRQSVSKSKGKWSNEGWNRDKHGPWLLRLWLLKINGNILWQTFHVLFYNGN